MSPFGMGGAEMLIVMLFYSGVGLPLGVPPAEPDPLMHRVAPEECLYYTTWAGMAKPDADSGVPTEALLAEPEVQEFTQHIDTAIIAGFRQLSRHAPGDEAKLLAESGPLFLKSLITSPTAIYLNKLQISPDGPVEIEGGMIVNAGDNTAKLRDTMLKLQANMPEDYGLKEIEIDGVTFFQFQPPQDAPLMTWGTRGKYLLIGMGDSAIENMFASARTGVPAWLTDLQEKLPVDRMSTLTYANLPAMMNAGMAGLPPGDVEKTNKIIAALGLNGIKSYGAVSGLEKEGFVNRTLVEIDGEGRGILALANAQPLTTDDLALVPADSTFAFAMKLDGQKVLDLVREIAGEIDPQAAAELEEGLDGLKQMIGLDLRGDVLAALGDTWCVYNSANEGGLLFTGTTLTVDLRDKAKADKVHEQLLALAKASLQPPADDEFGYYAPPKLKQIEFQGQTIHYVTGIEDMPLAPSWCVTETHLIVALYPQSIEAMLARDEDYQSLATTEEVARMLGAKTAPLSAQYVDTKTVFEMLYPLAKIFATGALNSAAEEGGIDIDVTILPRAETISRHLRPSVMSITRSERGLEFATRQSLPGSSMGSSAPVAVALILPAIQAAREAARRAQSMNNLKQIALAIHNYESANRKLPSNTTTEDGKPGLSWRVKILPYMGQQHLYDQFRMDEPWDSEHNRKLIEQMPTTYHSPGSTGPMDRTNYLGVGGEDGMFSTDGKEVSFAHVRDGLSQTAMVVEVDDRAAVTWTKPDDFDPADGMKPNHDLGGIWSSKVFLTAYGDGSVHAIHRDAAIDVLKAIFTKSGGEVFDWRDLEGPAHGDEPDFIEDAPREVVPDEFDAAPEEEDAVPEEFEAVP